ncbi:MAG: hypothetical protein HY435_00405 [Candidatus Liptonbacteria bacterium]|nr:hypothetical protein [Candidatus Liptonbacteria bacterium]
MVREFLLRWRAAAAGMTLLWAVCLSLFFLFGVNAILPQRITGEEIFYSLIGAQVAGLIIAFVFTLPRDDELPPLV